MAVENWSSEDLQILGFIGVGFTPEELENLGGLTDAVYEIFGVAHGWSPQQVSEICCFFAMLFLFLELINIAVQKYLPALYMHCPYHPSKSMSTRALYPL